MSTITEFYNYAKLAAAAYVELSDIDLGDGEQISDAIIDQEKLPSALARQAFSPISEEAGNGAVWTVAVNGAADFGYFGNDGTGFAATLFERQGQKALAIRGTEPKGDQSISDLIQADIAGIGVIGMALPQAVSMVNLINRMRKPVDELVTQLQVRTSLLKPAVASYVAATSAVGTLVYIYFSTYSVPGLELLAPDEKIDVVGHSLGGHLAALAARLFPSLVEDAYIFNSPGFDPASTSVSPPVSQLLTAFLAAQMGPAAALIGPNQQLTDIDEAEERNDLIDLFDPWLPEDAARSFGAVNIHNLEGEDIASGDDLDIVSSVIAGQENLGEETKITTESNSHLMPPLMDSLAVHALLGRLDPLLSEGDIGRLLELSSKSDTGVLEEVVERLHELFIGSEIVLTTVEATEGLPGLGEGNFDARGGFYEAVIAIENSVTYKDAQGLVSVVDLSNLLAVEIETFAENDIAFRYALNDLSPFALTGASVIYDVHNADGQLDIYDSSTGTGDLSLQYLEDRSLYLSELLRREAVGGANQTGISFLDFSGTVDDPVPETSLPSAAAQPRRYLFGGAEDADLRGADAADHIYGAGGNDALFGWRWRGLPRGQLWSRCVVQQRERQ